METPMEKCARILVVQDDPVLLGLISNTLRPDGHEVIASANPIEALDISRQDFQRIDLVVIRINLQTISGLEFAKRLARRKIEVPMLFTSASRTMADVLANSLGRTAVIEEPFTAAALRNAVKKCLSMHRRKSERPRVA